MIALDTSFIIQSLLIFTLSVGLLGFITSLTKKVGDLANGYLKFEIFIESQTELNTALLEELKSIKRVAYDTREKVQIMEVTNEYERKGANDESN